MNAALQLSIENAVDQPLPVDARAPGEVLRHDRQPEMRAAAGLGARMAVAKLNASGFKINGKAATDVITDEAWLKGEFISTVQQRGAAIIKARGLSSAASAANAACDTVRSLSLGTPTGETTSVAVCSDGSYGIPAGVIYSYPVTCSGGRYSIVQGLPIDEYSRSKMDATHQELLEERDGVKDLL